MTPTKSQELDQQFQELLERGLIMEILSLCVVPTILASKKGREWRMYTDSMAINRITIK